MKNAITQHRIQKDTLLLQNRIFFYFIQYLLVILFILSHFTVSSQQLPYHTQFRQFQSIINPASVNSDFFLYEYNIALLSSYRMQWVNQAETPRTFSVSGEFISNFGNNFELVSGLTLLQDRIGPLGTTGVYGRVGSIFTKDPYYGGLSVGFSFGMVQYRITADRIAWRDLDDPNIPLLNFSLNHPEIALGAFYYKRLESRGYFDGDNLYLGISAAQLLPAKIVVPVDDREVPFERVPHYYGTLGWYHFLNQEAFLETSLWAKYVLGTPLNVDFNARFQPFRTFWVGGGFNLNGLVHLETGVNVPGILFKDANLKVGYGFNYNISAFDLPFGTSHELNVGILFDSYR